MNVDQYSSKGRHSYVGRLWSGKMDAHQALVTVKPDRKAWRYACNLIGREKAHGWVKQEKSTLKNWRSVRKKWTALCTGRRDGRLTKLTTEWRPIDGRRKKGRQRRRRRDGLVAFAGSTWLRLPQGRDAWWHNDEAFVLQWLEWGCDEDGEEDYIIKKENILLRPRYQAIIYS